MFEDLEFSIADHRQLGEAVLRAFPDLEAVAATVHSPTVVTTIILAGGQIVDTVRWSFGASKTWSMIVLN